MGYLVLKRTGQKVFVPPESLADAIASQLYEAPSGSETVTAELRPGIAGETTIDSLGAIQAGGGNVEGEAAFRGRESAVRDERLHGGIVDTGLTVLESGLDEAGFGGFGVVADAVGGEDYREGRLGRARANPIASGIGKAGAIIGTTMLSGGTSTAAKIANATPLGAITKLGTKIGKASEGASFAAKAGRASLGAGVEGVGAGFGEAVQQLNNSEQPITWETATSALSSNMLFGGGVGGAAGLVGKTVEKGLRKARQGLDGVASKLGAADNVSDDLARLDSKGLDAAKVDELAAIETARVPQRAGLADEIGEFRREVREQKAWLATKGAKETELRVITKQQMKAEKAFDGLLDDPKLLATKPETALRALRIQENALEQLSKQGDNLRGKFAADETATRMNALEASAGLLERNRALQAKIADLTSLPSSARLTSIADASSALAAGGQKSMASQMLSGTVYSGAAGVAASIPLIGPMIAPFVGAAAAKMVFGKLGKATSEAAARTSKAVGAFLDVSGKVARATPVLATKVLGSVAYAPASSKKSAIPTVAVKKAGLAELYKTRTDEIKSQTAYGPDGVPVMRREARREMAARLGPIRAANPILADRMETIAARRLEFLSSKIPRRPDLGVLQTGPDKWQPSDMEMRTWARYAAGVEDPGAIEERLAAGTITPEDAEVMRTVYPERLAEIKRQIIEQLPTLRETLPYQRRLALSILTGVPVDAAMHPQILSVLQSSFTEEPGTEGGMQAPIAAPQFGSVKSQDATPSEKRAST